MLLFSIVLTFDILHLLTEHSYEYHTGTKKKWKIPFPIPFRHDFFQFYFEPLPYNMIKLRNITLRLYKCSTVFAKGALNFIWQKYWKCFNQKRNQLLKKCIWQINLCNINTIRSYSILAVCFFDIIQVIPLNIMF